MKVVIQRVLYAKVKVNREEISTIGRGLLILAGFKKNEKEGDLQRVAQKIVNLRIFEDSEGKMNLSVKDIGGEILCVSQFTLYARVKKGRRPSFDDTEIPEKAKKLYEIFCQLIEREGVIVKRGIFGAFMNIEFVNSGPVTIVLDSQEL